jgi:hypothetical protein
MQYLPHRLHRSANYSGFQIPVDISLAGGRAAELGCGSPGSAEVVPETTFGHSWHYLNFVRLDEIQISIRGI